MNAIKPLFLIAITIVTLLSCKKKNVEPNTPPPPSDYSHMEGNFLCNIEEEYQYDPGHTINYDKVLSLHVSNDTLYALNQCFVINSETQTEFTRTEDNGISIVTVTLTFGNDYNDLLIHYHLNGNQLGPDQDKTYTGSRTTFPNSSSAHIDEQIMNGMYSITFREYDTYMNIDTTYNQTVNVNFGAGYISIDSEIFGTSNFNHTFMNKNSWHNYSTTAYGETEERNFFWDRTDSLYFFKEEIVEDWTNQVDTVLFEFYGRHL